MTEAPVSNADFFSVASRQRSARRFAPDPVPDGLLRRLVQMAVYAPNAVNRQTWRFLIVTDPATRAAIGEHYGGSMLDGRKVATFAEALAMPGQNHTVRESLYLGEHFGEAPAMIVACDIPLGDFGIGPSLYPACQNLMLAATALGLGTIITTVWKRRDAQIRAILGVPDEWAIGAIIPVGWPEKPLGPPRRGPVDDVLYGDRWDQPFRKTD